MKTAVDVAVKVTHEITGEPEEVCRGYAESTRDLAGSLDLEEEYTEEEFELHVKTIKDALINGGAEELVKGALKEFKKRNIH